MSQYHEGLVWRHARLGGNEMLVLLALAHVADDEGGASLSHGQIADRIGADKTTIARVIDALTDAGYLRITGKASGSRAAVYEICIHAWGVERTGAIIASGSDHRGERVTETLGVPSISLAALEIPAGQPATREIPAPDVAVIEGPEADAVPACEGPDARDIHSPQREVAEAGAAVPLSLNWRATPVDVGQVTQQGNYVDSSGVIRGIDEATNAGDPPMDGPIIPAFWGPHDIPVEVEGGVKIQPLPPADYPQNDLGRALYACRIQIDPAEPFRWHRAAYAEALDAEIRKSGKPVADIIAAIRRMNPYPNDILAMRDLLAVVRRAV